MSISKSQPAKVLEFWRAIEALNPQPISKTTSIIDCNTQNYCIKLDRSNPLPWVSNAIGREKADENKEWKYRLECAIFDNSVIADQLEKKYNANNDSKVEASSSSFTRLFDLYVTKDGKLASPAFALSMAGWASGIMLKFGVDYLTNKNACNLNGLPSIDYGNRIYSKSGFIGYDLTVEAINAHLDIVKQNDAFVVTQHWLDELSKIVINACQLPFSQTIFSSQLNYLVNRYPVRSIAANIKSDPEDSMLNSFYLGDINLMAGNIKDFGNGLKSFLSGKQSFERVDVCSKDGLGYAFSKIAPSSNPVGKWPSSFPLAFSQQLAINEIWDRLRNKSGLFSVNGPPGTGKTTLLNDLIAAVIVDRAIELSKLDHPDDVFIGKASNFIEENSTYKNHYRAIRPAFTDSGIIIASSNNGAVENISLDLPKKEAVSYDVDYFSQLASVFIGNKPAWGLISAALGNGANKWEFNKKFWTSTDSFQALLSSSVLTDEQVKSSWKQSVSDFTSAINHEFLVRNELIERSKLPSKLDTVNSSIATIKSKVDSIQLDIKSLEKRISSYLVSINEYEAELKQVNYKLSTLRKPSFWSMLISLFKSKRVWIETRISLSSEATKLSRVIDDNSAKLKTAKVDKVKASNTVDALIEKLEILEQQKHSFTSLINDAQTLLGDLWPKKNANDADRELSSYWATPEWVNAQSQVFVAAMNLHKTFILCSAQKMKQNLKITSLWLEGKLYGKSDLAKVALDTLFLVIPVISTTFASLPRFLSGLEKESIPWLLIDEAGQATPQQAAGAIYRAKRTVVVGDPLQLEPVVTLPNSAEDALAKYYNVDEVYQPSKGASVQKLADINNPIGTYLSTGLNQSIWIGSPLRVHRRCHSPMFDICNKIAYNGLMVHGKKGRPEDINLPSSSWCNVQGTSSTEHWINDEGTEVNKLLTELKSLGVNNDDIFIVSPFTSVVKELRKIGKKHGIATSGKLARVGTVHTTQGKEASVVILVLGGNPSSPRAKEWAAKTPNLLNVALSRAKDRLYVVGNRQTWSGYAYFKDMGNTLF
jgi:peptidoglycan hydrolase CwlO-like protein